mgnify:CR=1 FL=1
MNDQLPKLEQGLLLAMQAIENQVARDISSRTPSESEVHGVSKTGPYLERIERISGFVLDAFADGLVGVDSIVVMSHSLCTALKLVVEELGSEGLGDVRSKDCLSTIRAISISLESVKEVLVDKTTRIN